MPDYEKVAETVARFALTVPVEPSFAPPPVVCREMKSDDRLTVGALRDLVQSEEDATVLRWARRMLRKAEPPIGITGEPISWAEATTAEHPYVVATKSVTEPAYAHLAAEARTYMAQKAAIASVSAVSALPGERVALRGADAHTGALVALIPGDRDVARLTSIPKVSEKPHDLHVTLYYPGQAADLDEDGFDKLLPRMRAVAANMAPIKARVAGTAVFNPTGDEPASVLILNDTRIGDCQAEIARIVESTLAAELVQQHKPFIPHVTLAYNTSVKVPPVVFDNPMRLDRLRLSWGEVDIDIPLRGRQ